jgi:hypothetical protein
MDPIAKSLLRMIDITEVENRPPQCFMDLILTSSRLLFNWKETSKVRHGFHDKIIVGKDGLYSNSAGKETTKVLHGSHRKVIIQGIVGEVRSKETTKVLHGFHDKIIFGKDGL